jgi:adenine-specific DNA-methyltransferase
LGNQLGPEDLQQRRSFSHIPYLSEQIIPYIGNKRRLLPLIYEVLRELFPDGADGRRFFDPFSGSGVVARLAKYLGFRVYANDWEHYAYLIGSAYLKINRADLKSMYGRWGGVEGVLAHLNSLPNPQPVEEYVARHYSPRDDAHPDYRQERLFYTRSNGLIIDAMRNEIERLYPGPLDSDDELLFREKALLLALLIHQAATHTNTSGVFKAYHKGFGGFSGDALSRILKPIALPYPVLIDSHPEQFVFAEDANKLLDNDLFHRTSFDVAYLDPPYNQHQYGSNYHLLNTVARWDRISTGDGKAGIRKDWILTRSEYCYQGGAPRAFRDLLERLHARHILISYSTEGIIPWGELLSLCSDKGKIRLKTNEYIKYRGGKQSNYRLNNNIEFIIIIDTEGKTLPVDLEDIDHVVIDRELNLQLKKCYVEELLRSRFTIDEKKESIGFRNRGQTTWIRTRGFFRLDEGELAGKLQRPDLSSQATLRVKRSLYEKLRECECRDRAQELEEILRIVKKGGGDPQYFISQIPGILRKIAHKKYRVLFLNTLESIRALEKRIPAAYVKIAGKIEEVEQLARKRFSG